VPDLPAHGSRFKEQPLTLDNAVSTLYDVIQKEAAGKKVGTTHQSTIDLTTLMSSSWLAPCLNYRQYLEYCSVCISG